MVVHPYAYYIALSIRTRLFVRVVYVLVTCDRLGIGPNLRIPMLMINLNDITINTMSYFLSKQSSPFIHIFQGESIYKGCRDVVCKSTCLYNVSISTTM